MIIESDFLVIGSGIAGLSFALQAADHGRVAIVTKREIAESATRYAQGGIASVFSTEDSFDAHIQDTMVAGAGICHEDVVRMVVEEGPHTIRNLIEVGGQVYHQYHRGRIRPDPRGWPQRPPDSARGRHHRPRNRTGTGRGSPPASQHPGI